MNEGKEEGRREYIPQRVIIKTQSILINHLAQCLALKNYLYIIIIIRLLG